MSKKKKQKTNLEIMSSIRRDWNGVNPVTKVMPDKRKYNRKKDRTAKEFDYDYNGSSVF